jgi:hypothetical protein
MGVEDGRPQGAPPDHRTAPVPTIDAMAPMFVHGRDGGSVERWGGPLRASVPFPALSAPLKKIRMTHVYLLPLANNQMPFRNRVDDIAATDDTNEFLASYHGYALDFALG